MKITSILCVRLVLQVGPGGQTSVVPVWPCLSDFFPNRSTFQWIPHVFQF